jgi:hypothetical protein
LNLQEDVVARKKQSRGVCAFCGQEFAKSGVVKHLTACKPYLESISKTEVLKQKVEPIFHLRVQAKEMPDFWFDIEMCGTATLGELDSYLRAIWLECCGHLSQFSFGGWQGEEISMDRKLVNVLEVGEELTHIYDFGTSSVTLVKAVGIRNGKPLTQHPITLLIRNVMPQSPCIECGQPATCLCEECLNDYGDWGIFCDEHAKSHPHTNYGDPVPLVNSPRMGACAYDGPAEPPY